MININKLNKILYNDYGIILSESEISYLKYLNSISIKNTTEILKEFFANCTTRHLCTENNKKEFKDIRFKLIFEEIGHDQKSHTSIYGNDSNIVDMAKYLDKEEIAEIEEETNTLNGNEDLNIKTEYGIVNKQFKTKAEADVYKKQIENNFLVRQGSATRKFGGTY